MLTRIKTALSFAPQVEYLEFEDGLLTVRCKKALSFKETSVKLKTSYGTVIARVVVESYDASNDVYRLQVRDRRTIPEQLETERRRERRLKRAVRVTSKYFPQFAGITQDISLSGLRVVTRGGLQAGHEIPLELELDDSYIPTLPLRAKVAWSAKREDGTYHSGLRFSPMSLEAECLIKKYLRTRLAVERQLHTSEDIDPIE